MPNNNPRTNIEIKKLEFVMGVAKIASISFVSYLSSYNLIEVEKKLAITEQTTQIPGADQFKYLTSVKMKKDNGITNNKYVIIGNKLNMAK